MGSLPACRPSEGSAERPGAVGPGQAPVAGQRSKAGAHWIFHPRLASPPSASLDLGGGARLEVDRAGSRWLVRGDDVEVSPFGAPEALVAVTRDGAKLGVVGESGAVYLSAAPLGEFEATRLPTERLLQASASGSVVVGTTPAGLLLRSLDIGRSWQEVRLPGFASDVAVASDGRVLALTAPERWFESGSAGGEFAPLDWQSVGPLGLGTSADGQVVVDGFLRRFVWDGAALVAAPGAAAAKAARALPRFASADDLSRGAAAWSGGRFWLVESERGAPRLSAGVWDEALEARPLEAVKGCGASRVAAAGRFVHVVCADRASSGVAPRLLSWSSADDGVSFTYRPLTLRGDINRVELAAHPSGGLAIAGVCPAENNEAGCQPRGVHFVRAGEKALIALPFLDADTPSSLAFSAEQLWSLGRRAKDGHAILSSVSGLTTGPARLAVFLDLERATDLPVEPGNSRLQLLPAADTVGVALGLRSGFHVLAVSPRGELLGFGRAPSGVEAVGGAGQRFYGVDPKASLGWETRTAGVDWRRESLPRSACAPPAKECRASVVCREAGCLVGEDLTRVGWGVAPAEWPLSASSRVNLPGQPRSHWLAASCAPQGDFEDISRAVATPDADDAALGDAAFFGLERDPNRASASALHARFGKKSLERHVLLADVADPERYAFAVSPQIEGHAVLRYRLPTGGAPSPSYGNIEVAWDNRAEGVLGHGQLTATIKAVAGDVESQSDKSARARPGLLSVAGRGVYLRLHPRELQRQPTYYFEADRQTQVADVAWPEALRGLDSEYLRVADHEVPISWSRAAELVVSQTSRTPLNFTPFLLLPLEAPGAARTVGVTYQGKNVALLTTVVDPLGSYWTASVVPISPGGLFETPRRVPLLADLPERPRACSERDRAETPRVVAPALPGPVREILFEEPGGQLVSFRSGRAILYGTLDDPCVAAFEAESNDTAADRGVHYRMLWFPGPSQVSWLFREESTGGARRLGARPIACVEPSARKRPTPAGASALE